jgi:hypothetical protein
VIVQQIGRTIAKLKAQGFTSCWSSRISVSRRRRGPALRDGPWPRRRHDSQSELDANMAKLHDYLGV